MTAEGAPGRNLARGSAERRGRPTACEIAEQLWPGPDPLHYCRVEAVARLEAYDRAIGRALDLRDTAQPIIFGDLGRLWIHPTRSEVLLASVLAELRVAAGHLSSALDLLASARSENSLRFYDERLRERQEREALRG